MHGNDMLSAEKLPEEHQLIRHRADETYSVYSDTTKINAKSSSIQCVAVCIGLKGASTST